MRRLTAVALALAGLAGCSDGSGPSASPAVERIAPRLAVMAVAVAASHEGRSLFDNVVACVRRGVVSHYDTPTGRHVTFSDCDLGAGVVVAGEGELIWVGTGLAPVRDRFCTEAAGTARCEAGLRWSGALDVTLDGSSLHLDGFEVDELLMRGDGAVFPPEAQVETGLGFVSLSFSAGGSTVPVSDRSLPAQIFDASALTSNSIPNPQGLAGLRDADLRRLALRGAMDLVLFLVDETSESRGDHIHSSACGTTSIAIDPVHQVPILSSQWVGCPAHGLLLSGSFTIRWADPAQLRTGTRLEVLIQGDLTVGGGIPLVRFDELSWTVTGLSHLPTTVTVSGQLAHEAETRPFSFSLLVDD